MADIGWSMHEIGKEEMSYGKYGLLVSRGDLRSINEIDRRAQVAFAREIVARAFQISVAEIIAPTRRTAPVALARQTAMYLTHVVFGMSISSVGRHFGRDRTTASHACRQIEDRRDDPTFDLLVDRLEFVVRSVNVHETGLGSTVAAMGVPIECLIGNSTVGMNQ